MKQEIVACVASPQARDAVARAALGRFTARWCVSAHSIYRLVSSRCAAMIVWEVTEDSASAENIIDCLANTAEERGQALAVLVVVGVSKTASRLVLALTRHAIRLQFCLLGHDDLEADVISFQADPRERTASTVIIDRLVPLVSARARHILVTAAVVAHRRTNVRAFAHACGVSARALQWTLHEAQVAPAKNLLAWVTALHSLWRLDALAWNPKRAWCAAGFTSRESWEHYIARHTGSPPARLLRNGGFESLLGRFQQELAHAGSVTQGAALEAATSAIAVPGGGSASDEGTPLPFQLSGGFRRSELHCSS
jgi:hypothetical protein